MSESDVPIRITVGHINTARQVETFVVFVLSLLSVLPLISLVGKDVAPEPYDEARRDFNGMSHDTRLLMAVIPMDSSLILYVIPFVGGRSILSMLGV